MRPTLHTTLSTLAALSAAVTGSGVTASTASAGTSPTPTFQHGLYSQGHYSSLNACNTARTATSNTLAAQNGVTNVATGWCHPYAFGSGATATSGYLFDMTYQRATAAWASDTNLGVNPARTQGEHSFRATRSGYATQAAALSAQNSMVATMKSNPKVTVTWVAAPVQNTVTKQWAYETDYNSRGPYSPVDVEISESAGVTAHTLGMTSSAPVSTTTTGSTVTTPGNATMGGTTTPKPPNTTTTTTTTGSGVKTTTTTGTGSGTKTTTTTTSTGSGTVTSTTTTTSPSKSTTITNPHAGVQGVDVSGNNGSVNFATLSSKGVKYAWIKAVEGTYYHNPKFNQQYSSATSANVIRGAYVFANPNSSNGTVAADYFINNGGGWSADGRTLPGALDIEWNPYGASCFGLSRTQMATWIRSFVTEYKTKTGTNPIIYTATAWWNQCVSSTASFTDVPLWLANYSTSPGTVPTGWAGTSPLVWQNSDGNGSGMDTDIFQGTPTYLKQYALTGKK